MSKSQLAQEAQQYKTIPNMCRYRRPDGTLIATPVLSKDDPGMDNSRNDELTARRARVGSNKLLMALRAARG